MASGMGTASYLQGSGIAEKWLRDYFSNRLKASSMARRMDERELRERIKRTTKLYKYYLKNPFLRTLYWEKHSNPEGKFSEQYPEFKNFEQYDPVSNRQLMNQLLDPANSGLMVDQWIATTGEPLAKRADLVNKIKAKYGSENLRRIAPQLADDSPERISAYLQNPAATEQAIANQQKVFNVMQHLNRYTQGGKNEAYAPLFRVQEALSQKLANAEKNPQDLNSYETLRSMWTAMNSAKDLDRSLHNEITQLARRQKDNTGNSVPSTMENVLDNELRKANFDPNTIPWETKRTLIGRVLGATSFIPDTASEMPNWYSLTATPDQKWGDLANIVRKYGVEPYVAATQAGTKPEPFTPPPQDFSAMTPEEAQEAEEEAKFNEEKLKMDEDVLKDLDKDETAVTKATAIAQKQTAKQDQKETAAGQPITSVGWDPEIAKILDTYGDIAIDVDGSLYMKNASSDPSGVKVDLYNPALEQRLVRAATMKGINPQALIAKVMEMAKTPKAENWDYKTFFEKNPVAAAAIQNKLAKAKTPEARNQVIAEISKTIPPEHQMEFDEFSKTAFSPPQPGTQAPQTAPAPVPTQQPGPSQEMPVISPEHQQILRALQQKGATYNDGALSHEGESLEPEKAAQLLGTPVDAPEMQHLKDLFEKRVQGVFPEHIGQEMEKHFQAPQPGQESIVKPAGNLEMESWKSKPRVDLTKPEPTPAAPVAPAQPKPSTPVAAAPAQTKITDFGAAAPSAKPEGP